MLGEKLLRALPRQIAGLFPVARALVAIKTVRRIRIGVDLGVWLLLLESLDYIHRDAVVFLAEMHLYRALRLLISEFADHSAIEGDRCRKSGNTAGCEKRGGAAHAEPDNAERARAFEVALRCGDIGNHVIPVQVAEIAAGVRDFVRGVATLEIAHEAVEHGRRNRYVSKCGEPITDRANVMIDAENLLHHHHAALGLAGWLGAVGAERMLVGGGQSELLTQRCLPLFFARNPAAFSMRDTHRPELDLQLKPTGKNSLHLSHRERSTREARRVRGYELTRVQNPLTPALSLWGEGVFVLRLLASFQDD